MRGHECRWIGGVRPCTDRCPSGAIVLGFNTLPDDVENNCDGAYLEYCCDRVTSNFLIECPHYGDWIGDADPPLKLGTPAACAGDHHMRMQKVHGDEL